MLLQRAVALSAQPVNQPVPQALIPFSLTPEGLGGEKIIFSSSLTDLNPGNYRLEYAAVGGRFDNRGGPANKLVPGLDSGNVYFYIASTWMGTTPVTVRLDVRNIVTNNIEFTQTWTFARRKSIPTKMEQIDSEKGFPLGKVYTYQLSGPKGTENYHEQTILERFSQNTCNIDMDDLKPRFKAAHPDIRTARDITNYFFGGPGDNGTFTIDNLNRVYDGHGGGLPTRPAVQAALKIDKVVHSDLPQIYEAAPTKTLARYRIRRILRTDGTDLVQKSKVT